MTRNQIIRLALASIVGVAVGGAIAAVAVAVFEMPTQITQVADPEIDSHFIPATPTQMAWNVIGLAMFGGIIGVTAGGPVFALIGLPLHGMLVKSRRTGLVAYALMGALVSGVIVTITQAGVSGIARIFDPSSWPATFGWAPWFALAGAIASSVFWLIRRPDRIAN